LREREGVTRKHIGVTVVLFEVHQVRVFIQLNTHIF